MTTEFRCLLVTNFFQINKKYLTSLFENWNFTPNIGPFKYFNTYSKSKNSLKFYMIKVYIMCTFNQTNTNTYWDCEIRKRHKICIFKFLKFMSMKEEKCLIPVKSSLLCVYNNNRDLKKISLYKRYFDDDLLTVRLYKIDEPKR